VNDFLAVIYLICFAAIAGGASRYVSSYVELAALAAARSRALDEQWTPRANAFLRAYGLRAAVYSWIEERRDDKGNKTGEAARCAVQFYNAADFDRAGGLGVVAAALTGAAQQTPLYAQPFYGVGAPLSGALAPMAPSALAPMAVPVAVPVAMPMSAKI
jgi:hypothetical protein